jgi:hypothetical protein
VTVKQSIKLTSPLVTIKQWCHQPVTHNHATQQQHHRIMTPSHKATPIINGNPSPRLMPSHYPQATMKHPMSNSAPTPSAPKQWHCPQAAATTPQNYGGFPKQRRHSKWHYHCHKAMTPPLAMMLPATHKWQCHYHIRPKPPQTMPVLKNKRNCLRSITWTMHCSKPAAQRW